MFLSLDRKTPPQTRTIPRSTTDDFTRSVIISSADILDADEKKRFEYDDPPPTVLRVTIPKWPIDKSSSQSNTRIKVYLRRYYLDCVWRDSSDPTSIITSNSGTSISKKIMIWLYVGAQGTTRLLKPITERTELFDPDITITRTQSSIGEWGSNPYGTVETQNTDVFFENQFCNMTEYYGQPGVYIGDVDPQAMSALKSETLVTLKITTDRSDFPSPFWYYRFLSGVSLWDPDKLRYDVVPAEHEIKTYFKKVDKFEVTRYGGPYMPTGLFKLDKPFLYQLHPHITLTTVDNMTDPLSGEFVVSNEPSVEMFVYQAGLISSTDLSDFNRSAFSKQQAPSDKRSFSIRLYNPDVDDRSVHVWDVANDLGGGTPSDRFLPYEPFYFPNGIWDGNTIKTSKTKLSTMSCFPFEQNLTINQLSVLDDKVLYRNLPSSAKYEILPNHLFLFMDGGSSWSEELFPGTQTSCTVGERALQFDLGKDRFINKIQFIFPRSQEDTQPTKFAASLQRYYGIDSTSDLPEAVWFGNYQHDSPYGNYESASTTKDYVYINTHSQNGNTLYGGTTNMMIIDEETAPSQKPFSGSATAPVYSSSLRGGRSHVVNMNTSGTSYVQSGPNDINPAFDFYRQEYGPFVRGCTLSELWNETLVKAVTLKGANAEWRTVQFKQGHYFTSITDFWFTSNILTLVQAYTYTIVGGALYKLTNTDNDKATLLNPDEQKYLYPLDFNETTPNDYFLKSSFTNLGDFILSNYNVYLVNTTPSTVSLTDNPMTDYIVKESYYFTSHYNQYTQIKSTANSPYRPEETELAQKIIRPELAHGRFFGLTCGSFLSDPGSPVLHRYTRGKGNHIHLYSVRLCTQLFSFTTNLGTLVDPSSSNSSNATFSKRYDSGILKECTVDYSGQKFTKDEYSLSTNVQLYPSFPDQPSADSTFIHPTSNVIIDRGEYLLTKNLDAVNHSASNIGVPLFQEVTPARAKATMVDDTDLKEYMFYLKASDKTPLRRFAEIQFELSTL